MAKKISTKKANMADEKNTDELPIKKEKHSRSNIDASNFKNVTFAYSQVGEEIIHQAENIFAMMDRIFGTSKLRPEVDSVPIMFDQLMQEKKPKDYIPVLEDFRSHAPGSLTDLLKAKYNYEKNTHKNQNDYNKTCITGGSGIEVAKANWDFAVNSFLEDKQDAEFTLKEAVYTARRTYKDVYFSDDEGLESKIDYHVDYFSEAVEVADAVDQYTNRMDNSNTLLVAAYTSLITEFNKNWNLIAAGELKLIAENRKDSKDLWKSIQSNYKK